MKLITVSGASQLEQFIRMPFRLYREDPRWVPPLVSAELKMMDPQRNPFYDHAEAAHFMLERDGQLVGRISAINNKLHNQVQNQKTGFWGYYESENDPAVSGALFEAAAAWLRERGLNRMLGPVNPSINSFPSHHVPSTPPLQASSSPPSPPSPTQLSLAVTISPRIMPLGARIL